MFLFKKKNEIQTVNIDLPYNSSNFGEYTLTLSDNLKKINKTFKETTDLSKSK